MPAGQLDRRARHAPRQLQEGDDRAGEGDRADGDAETHLDAADGGDIAGDGIQDAERRRIEVGRDPDQHRRHADEAVEARDEFRHRGHLDLAGDVIADAAADRDRADDQRQADTVLDQRRADRNDHADHAEAVALLTGLGRRQAPQRKDEQHPGNEVGEQHPGGRRG